MTYLLDTHILLWWVTDDAALPRKARAAISDSRNHFLVSPVSFWEIAIKRSIGKLSFNGTADDILRAGPFATLLLTTEHAWAVGQLPWHHKDPFDRLLVAQASQEAVSLMTHDPQLKPYGRFIVLL